MDPSARTTVIPCTQSRVTPYLKVAGPALAEYLKVKGQAFYAAAKIQEGK